MKKYLTILLEKAVISQTNIGSVSKATLGKHLSWGCSANMGFPEHIDILLDGTKLNYNFCCRCFFSKTVWMTTTRIPHRARIYLIGQL